MLTVAEHADPPFHAPLPWTTHTEPREGPDDFLDQILEHVRQGKSFTCLGPPGVGKTWILARVKECLEGLGHNIACLAPTHSAARLLPGGDTIHHFVGKFAMRGAFKGWILLDEISMCGLGLLAALDQLRLNGTKICTFGDWRQLPPHPDSNSWRGSPVSATAFRGSRLYKSWSDGTCFELTRCRRSDEAHFQFYTNEIQGDMARAVSAARRQYGTVEDADLHVTISHRKRRAISSAKQARAAVGKECIQISAGDDPSYQCFVNTRLVGNATAGKIINGARYTVKSIGERIALKDEMTGEEFDVTLENLSRQCILAWAMCYPKVQGCTEQGTVLLHDMGSKHLRRHHLYVGLSRVVDGANVFISAE